MSPHIQLFAHVTGAVALFAAVAAVSVLGLTAGRSPSARSAAVGAIVTILFVATPAWVVMVTFGFWTRSKMHLPTGYDWITLPTRIADVGVVALLAMATLAYIWFRRPSSSRLPLALGLVSAAYLLALGVAWWAMTAKVPS